MNSIVTLSNGCPVTTSLAIAEGVGNSHKSVIELIRKQVSDLEEFGRVAFETRPFETPGGTQNREIVLLNEHQATLLITFMRNIGIVKEFKKRLVKAFFEMRDELNRRQNQSQNVDSLSRMDILRLAMESEEERLRLEQENQALEHKIHEDAPKVTFANQVIQSDDAITVSQAAKVIGTGRSRLFAFMREIAWVNRKNEPYQRRITEGYLDVKLSSFDHPDFGLQHRVTTLVTGRGLAKIQDLWAIRHSLTAYGMSSARPLPPH